MIKDKKTILIVDDQSTNIFALSAVLIPRGYTCTAALSGEQCLTILRNGATFDIILMDMMMPLMDGINTIRYIRNLPGFLHSKIIMVTADNSPALKQQSVSIGANGFITKPVDIDQLVALF